MLPHPQEIASLGASVSALKLTTALPSPPSPSTPRHSPTAAHAAEHDEAEEGEEGEQEEGEAAEAQAGMEQQEVGQEGEHNTTAWAGSCLACVPPAWTRTFLAACERELRALARTSSSSYSSSFAPHSSGKHRQHSSKAGHQQAQWSSRRWYVEHGVVDLVVAGAVLVAGSGRLPPAAPTSAPPAPPAPSSTPAAAPATPAPSAGTAAVQEAAAPPGSEHASADTQPGRRPRARSAVTRSLRRAEARAEAEEAGALALRVASHAGFVLPVAETLARAPASHAAATAEAAADPASPDTAAASHGLPSAKQERAAGRHTSNNGSARRQQQATSRQQQATSRQHPLLPAGWMGAVEEATLPLLASMTSGDLIRMLQAYVGQLGARPSHAWWAALEAATPPSALARMPAYACMALLQSMGSSGYRPSRAWLVGWEDATVGSLSRFTPLELVQSLVAFASLQVLPGKDWLGAWLAASRAVAEATAGPFGPSSFTPPPAPSQAAATEASSGSDGSGSGSGAQQGLQQKGLTSLGLAAKALWALGSLSIKPPTEWCVAWESALVCLLVLLQQQQAWAAAMSGAEAEGAGAGSWRRPSGAKAGDGGSPARGRGRASSQRKRQQQGREAGGGTAAAAAAATSVMRPSEVALLAWGFGAVQHVPQPALVMALAKVCQGGCICFWGCQRMCAW